MEERGFSRRPVPQVRARSLGANLGITDILRLLM